MLLLEIHIHMMHKQPVVMLSNASSHLAKVLQRRAAAGAAPDSCMMDPELLADIQTYQRVCACVQQCVQQQYQSQQLFALWVSLAAGRRCAHPENGGESALNDCSIIRCPNLPGAQSRGRVPALRDAEAQYVVALL